MKPSSSNSLQQDLFKSHFNSLVDKKDPIIVLADTFDWIKLNKEVSPIFKNGPGRPPKPIRLMVGILILQHIDGLSDAKAIKELKYNIYWQYFCGFNTVQTSGFPDPSSLTRWRKKLGKKVLSNVLKVLIDECIKHGLVKSKDLKKVIVDTTVMEKNITFPTDGKLLNKLREKIVKFSKDNGIKLRQSYKNLGKKLLSQSSRYAHAKQMKRVKRTVKKLKTYLGRVVRDVQRKASESMQAKGTHLSFLLSMAQQLLCQTKNSKNKLYSIHEPLAYCISKGKNHKRYEFGSKVSIVTTNKQGLILNMNSLPKNIHDSKTLQPVLSEVREKLETEIEEVFVDRGYRGHSESQSKVYISGKRGLSKSIKNRLRRRSSIEPHISHMKSDGKLDKNYLKGLLGDDLNCLLCGIGHNARLLLNYISNTSKLKPTY